MFGVSGESLHRRSSVEFCTAVCDVAMNYWHQVGEAPELVEHVHV